MALSSGRVRQLVDAELSRIRDDAARARIRELLVPPYPVQREWYYGVLGQLYTCWTVLEDPAINVAVPYCEEGFGPQSPWGLVARTGPHMGIGMDSEWFGALEEALKDFPLWDEPSVHE